MSQVVYGVFRDEEAAGQAVARAQAESSEKFFHAVVHDRHVREEDVQLGGTSAIGGMILGVVLVAVIGAAAAALFVWPMAGLSFGLSGALLIAVGCIFFGVVAGAVAGASEVNTTLKDGAERAEAHGEVLVTCEVERQEAASIMDVLSASGAREVQAA